MSAERGYSLAGLLRLLAAVSTAKAGTADEIEKKRKKIRNRSRRC